MPPLMYNMLFLSEFQMFFLPLNRIVSTGTEHPNLEFRDICPINKTNVTVVNYLYNCLYFRKGTFFAVLKRCY